MLQGVNYADMLIGVVVFVSFVCRGPGGVHQETFIDSVSIFGVLLHYSLHVVILRAAVLLEVSFFADGLRWYSAAHLVKHKKAIRTATGNRIFRTRDRQIRTVRKDLVRGVA